MRNANILITAFMGVLAVLSWGFAGYQAWVSWTIAPMYMAISIMVTVCACIGWIMINIQEMRRDGQTRCRKCGHILRGLTEPRCPECGTPI